MKLFSKRKKSIFYSALFFILFFYFLINYFDLSIFSNDETPVAHHHHHKEEKLNDVKILQLIEKKEANIPPIIVQKTNKPANSTTTQSVQSDQRTRYYAYDGNGLGSVNTGVTKCQDGIEVEVTGDLAKADFSYFLNSVPHSIEEKDNNERRHYYMVYAMESEPHSGGGDSWTNADFRMWYNLDSSYPEPATYFDIKSYLPDLLSKPRIDFENKEASAPLVWVLSNCAAFNGRESYIRRLMNLLQIDSYGGCLRNKNTHSGTRMQGNIELYAKYKFVIAIENSNCQDYVTEKLVHAVASGSIPIVAGKNGKPDYASYLPKGSYINIYDFKTADELAAHVKSIMNDKKKYEEHIYFKRNHKHSKEELLGLSLSDLIDLAKTLIDPVENAQFFNGIVGREKSENKLCKVARHLKNTPKDQLHKEIKEKRIRRPSTEQACLTPGNLARDFN